MLVKVHLVILPSACIYIIMSDSVTTTLASCTASVTPAPQLPLLSTQPLLTPGNKIVVIVWIFVSSANKVMILVLFAEAFTQHWIRVRMFYDFYNRWMDGQMHRLMDGQRDRQTDGRTKGQTDISVIIYNQIHSYIENNSYSYISKNHTCMIT